LVNSFVGGDLILETSICIKEKGVDIAIFCKHFGVLIALLDAVLQQRSIPVALNSVV